MLLCYVLTIECYADVNVPWTCTPHACSCFTCIACHATPMLTCAELVPSTHALVLRAHALHATPMLTFAELVHSTHALVLRAHTLHATPMLTFAALVLPTHALVLRAHALHATPIRKLCGSQQQWHHESDSDRSKCTSVFWWSSLLACHVQSTWYQEFPC